MNKLTTPPKRPSKPKAPPPKTYVLCIGKWASMALTAEIYGFEVIEMDKQQDGKK